jgi:hypothetical protein
MFVARPAKEVTKGRDTKGNERGKQISKSKTKDNCKFIGTIVGKSELGGFVQLPNASITPVAEVLGTK